VCRPGIGSCLVPIGRFLEPEEIGNALEVLDPLEGRPSRPWPGGCGLSGVCHLYRIDGSGYGAVCD
jgi:hypothetical protein